MFQPLLIVENTLTYKANFSFYLDCRAFAKARAYKEAIVTPVLVRKLHTLGVF